MFFEITDLLASILEGMEVDVCFAGSKICVSSDDADGEDIRQNKRGDFHVF